MTAVAFFDVDRTLMKGHSGFFTTIELIRHRILKKRHLPKAVWYACFATWYQDHGIERMYAPAIAAMAGWAFDDIMAIGRQCVNRWIKSRIYAEALAAIVKYRAAGVPVILLSSGPYMTIQHVAEWLGVTESYSIGPAVENGRLVNRLQSPVCYKEGKVTLAQQVVAARGVTLKDCAFYTDSIADLALLECVGEPVIVNPDRALKRVARQRRWPIIRWHALVSA